MSHERRGPPEQHEGPVRHVRWARSFEITEFSQRSPSDTILQLPSWDIPVSQGRFRRPKTGSAVPWDDIVLSPRADRHHNARANDRAAAYAYRRALDLERVPGVCDHLPDPAIIIFLGWRCRGKGRIRIPRLYVEKRLAKTSQGEGYENLEPT